ncbi:CvpA family protein [Lactobacillaceae bacterium L1_55_11]|nr:CvpA family protein [Lactobacillaceae bacterium L1_55_11]
MVILIIGIAVVLLMAYRGYQDGIMTVLGRLILWILIFYLALRLSRPLGDFLTQMVTGHFVRPDVPSVYSDDGTPFLASGLAFTLILLLGKLLMHFILRPIHLIRHIPVLGQLDGLLGAVGEAGLALVICFFVLQVLSVIPNAWLQDQLVTSPILNRFLNEFPFFSENIYQWWL